MDDIIDDCLRCILERLPLHDRLRLEIVCRKWFQLMPYSNVTAFALDDVPWPDRHVHELSYEHNNLKFSQPVMQPRRFCRYMNFLLDRIGPHLRTLSLAPRRISFRPLVTPELAQLIADLCTNVTSIILTSCILESSATDQLARLRHLSYINLSTAVFLEDNRLNLVNHQVLSAKLDALLSTLRLERLNLAHCPFVVAIKSDTLRRLQLQASGLNSQDLAIICENCPRLHSIVLSECRNILDFGVIARLPMLNVLWVNGCKLTNEHLASICHGCPQIVSLRINDCTLLTDFLPLKNLRAIETLSVGPNNRFGDAILARIARNGTLINLGASNCAISDHGLCYLASRCRRLLEVSLSCTSITDQGVIMLMKNCHNLQLLNIQFTSVSNETLKAVATTAYSLRALYVQSCRELDEEGFLYLYESRRSFADECAKLEIQAGGERGTPISHWLISKLQSIGISLIVQRPLLALPGLGL